MTEVTGTIGRIESLEAAVAELRGQVNRLARRKGRDPVSGDPVAPTNDCSLCLGSDGKPTFHINENGQIRECTCKAPFLLAEKRYKEQVARLVRAKVKIDADARRAGKVLGRG
jgi:hypothetical protein